MTTMILNKTDNLVEESTLIMDYIRTPTILSPSQSNQEVQDILERNSAECAVVCGQKYIPIGLVMKDRFFRHLGKPFGASLYYRQSITKLMEGMPLIVDKRTPVQNVIDQALSRDEAFLYDCIIITDQQKLVGVVTVGDLLNISRILQKKSAEEHIRIVIKSKQLLEEINVSVNQVTLSTFTGKMVSESMMESTTEGNQQLQKILNAFDRYSKLTSHQEEQIRDLEKSMNAAKEIIEAIRELANQLNILSINASIEAAKAKENGMSFSVVANEVKRISGNTKIHAEEIQEKLRLIQECVNSTVSLVEAGRNETLDNSNHANKTAEIFQALFTTISESGKSANENHNFAKSAANETSKVMQSMNDLITGMKAAHKTT